MQRPTIFSVILGTAFDAFWATGISVLFYRMTEGFAAVATGSRR